MYATLLCLTLAANPATIKADHTSFDGNWIVVSAEKDGQPQADAKGKTVIAKDNTFTCTGKDGKAGMSMKVEFGKNGTMKSTELTKDDGSPVEGEKKAKDGVFVLTGDYLALCIHDEDAAKKCTILLQREARR